MKSRQTKNGDCFVVRVKKKGLAPYVYRFTGYSYRKVYALLREWISESYHDLVWTICDQRGCEVKRGVYAIKE